MRIHLYNFFRATLLVNLLMFGLTSAAASRESEFHLSGRVVDTPVRRMLKQYRPLRRSATGNSVRSGYGPENKYNVGNGGDSSNKYGGDNKYQGGSGNDLNLDDLIDLDVPNVPNLTSYPIPDNDGGEKDLGHGTEDDGDSDGPSYTGESGYDHTYSPPPPKPSSWVRPGHSSSGYGSDSNYGPYNRLRY